MKKEYINPTLEVFNVTEYDAILMSSPTLPKSDEEIGSGEILAPEFPLESESDEIVF